MDAFLTEKLPWLMRERKRKDYGVNGGAESTAA